MAMLEIVDRFNVTFPILVIIVIIIMIIII